MEGRAREREGGADQLLVSYIYRKKVVKVKGKVGVGRGW